MSTTSSQSTKIAANSQSTKIATSTQEARSATGVYSGIGSPYPQVGVRVTQNSNVRITQSGDRRIRS